MKPGPVRSAGIGGGSIEPLSPVEVARMRLGENPIWRQNRPGHWGSGKDAIYYGAFLMALLAAAGGIYGTISWGALSTGGMVVLSFLLCPIQCLATVALIYLFDFLRTRKEALEEIALTRLGMSDIAYGSFASGTRAPVSFILPLLVTEISMWGAADWQAGLLAAILLPPFRWLLYCHAVNRFLKRLTSLQPVDAASLVSLPFLCMIQAALCIVLGFFAIPTMAYFLGPGSPGGVIESLFTFIFLFAPVGYVVAIWWGRTTLTQGWRGATENLYRRLEM